MINKAKKVLKTFSRNERKVLHNYFKLCSTDNKICDLWKIDSKELDKIFDNIRNKRIPMYENNSSFQKVYNRYMGLILQV